MVGILQYRTGGVDAAIARGRRGLGAEPVGPNLGPKLSIFHYECRPVVEVMQLVLPVS